MNTDFKIGSADIQSAALRIEPFVLETPTLFSERVSNQLDCCLNFKAENLQHIGAFKARGATNAVMQLDEQAAARGVLPHASGNYAAALASAAKLRGISAYVVMPQKPAPEAGLKIKSARYGRTASSRFAGKTVAAIVSGGNLNFGNCRLGTR